MGRGRGGRRRPPGAVPHPAGRPGPSQSSVARQAALRWHRQRAAGPGVGPSAGQGGPGPLGRLGRQARASAGAAVLGQRGRNGAGRNHDGFVAESLTMQAAAPGRGCLRKMKLSSLARRYSEETADMLQRVLCWDFRSETESEATCFVELFSALLIHCAHITPDPALGYVRVCLTLSLQPSPAGAQA